MTPDHLEKALFVAGSFRDAEAKFGLTRGVWRTCVGYAGGSYPTPSYNDIGDHAEAVMVEYAPQTISYGQLLEIFLCCCVPADATPRRQAAVFFRTEQERRLARAAVERRSLCNCGYSCSQVRILPFKTFFRAENPCQKYDLHTAAWLYDELVELYGAEEALLCSTLATRLNAYLRHPSPSTLRSLPESTDLYGLSPSDIQALLELAC